jgi:predicted dehydrogenase
VSLKRERKLRIFQPDTYISLDYGTKRMRVCRRGEAPPGGLAPIEVEEHEIAGEDALAEEIRAFLDAVRTRRPPLVSGREGLRAVELAYQILERLEDELRRSA